MRCALVDDAGHALGITYYRVSIATSEGRDGFGGGGSAVRDIRFYWPPGARSVDVRLHGRPGQRGKVQLTAPQQRCEVKAPAPSTDTE